VNLFDCRKINAARELTAAALQWFGPMRVLGMLAGVALFTGVAAAAAGAPAPRLKAGDCVFSDSEATILKLDSASGQVSVLAAGGALVRPCGLAAAADHTIYVADTGCQGVVAVDGMTGESRMLAQGPELGVPFGIALSDRMELFVANSRAILQVDVANGAIRTVSGAGVLRVPLGLGMGPDGDVLVADAAGAIVRVDPASGAQTVVASGGYLRAPVALTVCDQRTLYVTDAGAHCILRVDARTGSQSVVSTAGLLASPFGVVTLQKHELLVSDPDAFGLTGGLIRIDARTGEQSPLVSGSGNFVNFRCLAMVPDQGASGGLQGNNLTR
jgi:streptogramin lyase